jgi:ATP-dependent Clp protease ATP-binding subunit ClpA
MPGAELMDRPSIGFTMQDHSSDGMEAIKRLFTPEFRNRLDAIVQFKGLTPVTIAQVVDKFLIELEAQLEPRR